MDGYYIYIVENLIDGSMYIGVSNNPKRRWSEHKKVARREGKKQKYFLHRVMHQYRDNLDNVFRMSIVERFDTSEEVLFQEIYWIAKLKEIGVKLYNLTDGGEALYGENNYFYGKRFVGSQHSLYGTKRPQNVLDALSKAHKGKIIPEALRQQWSKSHKGLMSGDKNPMFGKTGETNPNHGISDVKAIEIHKMYHIENKLVREIIHITGIPKSTIDRVIYGYERFVWLKTYNH